jgi:hypothetical protein
MKQQEIREKRKRNQIIKQVKMKEEAHLAHMDTIKENLT